MYSASAFSPVLFLLFDFSKQECTFQGFFQRLLSGLVFQGFLSKETGCLWLFIIASNLQLLKKQHLYLFSAVSVVQAGWAGSHQPGLVFHLKSQLGTVHLQASSLATEEFSSSRLLDRPHYILPRYWPDVSLSSLWPSPLWQLASSGTANQASVRKEKVTVFCNLITEVSSSPLLYSIN